MTITHYMYKFDAHQLIDALSQHVNLADQANAGYSAIRLNALKLFDENANLRLLLDEYGAWDKASIETLFPADEPYKPDDMAFWILFIVLNQMTRINSPEFKPLYIAQFLQWEPAYIQLIYHGRPLKEFVQRYLYKTNNISVNSIPSYWDYVHPVSTGGNLGWLSIEDVEALLRKLESVPQSDDEVFQSKVDSTKDMLSSIYQQGMCIGVVLSG